MTRYTEGFSHFVTSMTAPVASGRSDSCRVGLAPTSVAALGLALVTAAVMSAEAHSLKKVESRLGDVRRHRLSPRRLIG